MRTLLNICMVAVVLAIASPAIATIYTVNLGETNVLSDSLITLSDWGEAESGGQDPSGTRGDGNYGGIGNGNCRMVLGNEYSGDSSFYAYITFPEDIASVTIRHLNGTEYDSFNVHVDNVFWGNYVGVGVANGEIWKEKTFAGEAGSQLMITLTGELTGHEDLYGQLAIDWVSANTVPEPATIALLGLGGLLLRRKRSKA